MVVFSASPGTTTTKSEMWGLKGRPVKAIYFVRMLEQTCIGSWFGFGRALKIVFRDIVYEVL